MPRTIIFVLALVIGTGAAPLSLFFASGLIHDAKTAGSLLQRLAPHSAHAQKAPASKGATKYTCPMHPHYIASEMGNCPICGMDLVLLPTGDDSASDSASGGTGDGKRQTITVSAETIQNMGVRTARVEKTLFGRKIRAYGIVKENEKLQQVISNRLDGWIEELKIRAIGDRVTKGTLLYKVYSPELFVSQRDYLSTIKGKNRNNARSRATSQRLRSYGVQPKAIRLLAKRGKVMMNMPFFAQSNGVISELNVSSGSFVKRGSMIAKIQDYSQVWLMVSIAEQDLGFLKKNSRAEITFPTLKDRKVTARIDYIYPTVDVASRTGQVRLVIKNTDGLLRPGTYADVVFSVDARHKLAVPTESLLHSEAGRYVVVAKGEGRFEPRLVKTGLIAGGQTEIVEGLKKGEEIVVSGQFLLDSESALRESFRKLERLQTPLPLLNLDKAQLAMVDHLVDAALYLHESQIDGYDVDAKFLAPAHEIRNLMWSKFQHTQLAPVLKSAEKAIGKAQKARTTSMVQTSLNDLVKSLKPWMLEGKADYYKAKNLNMFEEIGAKRRKGRLWIQQGDKPLNPYGNKKSQRIPWPTDKIALVGPKPTDKQQTPMSMRGSHAQ